jgi:hypothetical protein
LRGERDDHQTWQQRNRSAKKLIHISGQKNSQNSILKQGEGPTYESAKLMNETAVDREDSKLDWHAAAAETYKIDPQTFFFACFAPDRTSKPAG